MGTRLTIKTPSDYRFARDVCSYGYFLVAPNHWDPDQQVFYRVLELSGGPACVRIGQTHTSRERERAGLARLNTKTARSRSRLVSERAVGQGASLRASFDRSLSRAEQHEARAQITRMLRLDESAEDLAAFHRVDPRWKKTERGRLFRSPTLFEDVIKTVTSCNVNWPSTVKMNERLCAVCGRKSPTGRFAFPRPQRLARTRPGTLRGRCRVGYRDGRMIELARLFARGKIDEAWLTDPAVDDEVVFKFLVGLPGIGPYGAGNIMMLLGRYSRLAIDTETIRHAKQTLGYTGTDAQLTKKLHAHYEPFGAHKFRSYWFEAWAFYETKAGPSELWKREEVGSSFTASNF